MSGRDFEFIRSSNSYKIKYISIVQFFYDFSRARLHECQAHSFHSVTAIVLSLVNGRKYCFAKPRFKLLHLRIGHGECGIEVKIILCGFHSRGTICGFF